MHTVIHDVLGLWKLSCWWVTRILTDNYRYGALVRLYSFPHCTTGMVRAYWIKRSLGMRHRHKTTLHLPSKHCVKKGEHLRVKACAHWCGLPHSCGLVDCARSKFHTLARSYMRSRRGLHQIGSAYLKQFITAALFSELHTSKPKKKIIKIEKKFKKKKTKNLRCTRTSKRNKPKKNYDATEDWGLFKNIKTKNFSKKKPPISYTQCRLVRSDSTRHISPHAVRQHLIRPHQCVYLHLFPMCYIWPHTVFRLRQTTTT